MTDRPAWRTWHIVAMLDGQFLVCDGTRVVAKFPTLEAAQVGLKLLTSVKGC